MAFLERNANRGSIPTGPYEIDNSVKLERDNAEGFNFTNSGAGNRKTWTISYWFKRTEFGGGYDIVAGANTGLEIGFDPNNRFQVYDGGYLFRTTRVFRDPSAFYHIVVQLDTTQSTASNRIKLYVNGVEETDLDTDSPPSQNADLKWNNTGLIFYVGYFPSANYYSNGYLADLYSIDGQVVAPTEFGEFDEDSGIWKPKKYTGSYGTNGFKLEFKDSSALNTDTSGSNKSISLNNVAAADQATDTPTNNFATLNILNVTSNGGGNNEYTEGATKGKALETSEMASGTMAVTQGKWYYECKAVSNSEIMAGWGVPNKWGHHSVNPGYDEHSFAVHNIGRAYYYGNTYVDFSPSVSFDTNDIISVALDADNGFCYWAKNGTWMNGGSPTSGSTGTGGFNYIGGSTGANMKIVDGDFLVPAFRTNYYTNSAILLNFGGYTTISISSAASDANGYGTFEYAPPSGYYALCSKNLAEYG